ncbi:MAG: hypothetical protein ABIP79_10290 [Chitinophagaceae bacterium]
MKSIIIKSMTVLFICTSLFGFTSKPGGEGFEILLNNEVVLQQFGNSMNTVKSLRLNQSSQNEKLSIKYFHCGKIGKNRTITLKNSQDKVLKTFSYKDVSTASSAMMLNVKDILAIKKENGNSIKLYYAASELANERMLAILIIPDIAK